MVKRKKALKGSNPRLSSLKGGGQGIRKSARLAVPKKGSADKKTSPDTAMSAVVNILAHSSRYRPKNKIKNPETARIPKLERKNVTLCSLFFCHRDIWLSLLSKPRFNNHHFG